ncbi:hypothetical protein SESI111939_16760 [Serratia silvae]
MNFQQLKIIRESARCNYNLTDVANALFTSQSGVSRHIRELEEELGIEIFIRRGKRLLGMTGPGKELLVVAERILNDANNIRRLAIAAMLACGEADIGIASERLMSEESLAAFLYYRWHLAVDYLPPGDHRALTAGCGIQSCGVDAGYRAKRSGF